MRVVNFFEIPASQGGQKEEHQLKADLDGKMACAVNFMCRRQEKSGVGTNPNRIEASEFYAELGVYA